MKRVMLFFFASGALAGVCGIARAQLPVSIPLPRTATYAVKFVCGFEPGQNNVTFPSEPPVKPGNYATAVNILNYHSFPVRICKKVRVAVPESCSEDKAPAGTNCRPFIGVRANFVLQPEQAIEVDCNDIATILGAPAVPLPSFIKGFVEVIVPLPQGRLPTVNPLAVTGVYTALQCVVPGAGAVCTTDTELFPGGLDVVPELSQTGELPLQCIPQIGPGTP